MFITAKITVIFIVNFVTNILCLKDFLSNLSPSLSVDDNKIMRWHPKFHLDEVPDVEEGKLPQPPVVKTYSSANDVLEKARDMIAPRVCHKITVFAFLTTIQLLKN